MRLDEEEHVFYQKRYFEINHKKSMQPSDSPYIERQTARVIRWGNLSKKEKIIDIGCGIGKYTLNLHRKGYRIEGLDIAQGLLEQLQKHNSTDRLLPVHCADVAKPPAELSNQFDVAIGFFALHHMFDLQESFRGIAKLLKPGGRLLFLEPNPYNLLYYLQILFTPKMTWQGDKGILKMRSSILFPALRQAAFEELSIRRSGFFPPLIDNLKGALLIEQFLERFPLWNPLLPFQLILAKKKGRKCAFF